MIINVINLDPDAEKMSVNVGIKKDQIKRFREERLISLCRQSKEQGFAFRMWDGILDERGGWAGIIRAYQKIVEHAMITNMKMVCIAEDDIVFSAPSAWEYFLDQMPKRFDIYSGGVYSASQIENRRILNGYSGNTLIVIKNNFYEEFLKLCKEALECSRHLDRQLGMYGFKNYYILCEPYVVYQLQGFSDNHKQLTRHSGFLDDMNLFGR